VRRALTWLAGAVGLAALARLIRRRAAEATPVADPAEELREKLAEQRRQEGTAGGEEIVAPEPDPKPADPADTVDLEERRARVHARAQEAIELMSDGSPEAGPEDDATS
jgi:flagellar biosynthesis/type III secretory pathway M-ring protein FliF/YscJ